MLHLFCKMKLCRMMMRIAVIFILLLSVQVAKANEAIELHGEVSIQCETEVPAVKLAVADLAADFERVLGVAGKVVEPEESADVVIRIDPDLVGTERWICDVSRGQVTITGSEPLGAIYGVYEFSRRELGVDPLWYWKDLQPEKQDSIRLKIGRTESVEPTFRYRGWFVNDEDLLTEWRKPAGRRDIRYLYYGQVISLDVADRIFEALLRSGGNLVIPASFVDVMNPPEAALVRRAAERGLFVTQHHIEPLGVSHFGFENYWRRKGQTRSFHYGSEPDAVREVWRAFATRWYELAGDRVVWQLGLRGKADRAIWSSDSTVSRAEAGRFVSRAIAEQWEIVREVDPRPQPPATTTLWLEGSQLMSEGSLKFPEGVTIVFADEGSSQQMQSDFHRTPRDAERTYGVYYHVGFWSRGPHLLQGTSPARVKEVFDQVICKGDTHYAIINVCNIREHVLGIDASMAAMRGPWSVDEFMKQWSPPCLHESYDRLIDSFISIEGNRLLQDGAIFQAIDRILDAVEDGRLPTGGLPVEVFDEAIGRLNRIIDSYPADQIPPSMRDFYDVNLLTQAKMWRALLQCVRELKSTGDAADRLDGGIAAIEEFLAVRERAAQGKWENWYRGDKKVNTPSLLRRMKAVHEKLSVKNKQ